MILLGAKDGFAEETKPEQHLFLVDVSGSMKAKPPGSKLSHLELRKTELKEWFTVHPNSSVTLMSFYSRIEADLEKIPKLGDSINIANKWVDRRAIQKGGGTHLWECLRAALKEASTMTRDKPDGFVMVHVRTDGLDTERRSSLDAVIQDFRNAQTIPGSPPSQELGDFDVKVLGSTAPAPPPGATASPSTVISGPPTPGPKPVLPIASASPATPVVAFEIQEPRIVSSDRVVHFVNKTLPPADSYSWTIRRDVPGADSTKTDGKQQLSGPLPSPSATPEQDPVEQEETGEPGGHLKYQFTLPDLQPRSYTVHLVAKYGTTTIAATPMNVLVQPPSAALDAAVSETNDAVTAAMYQIIGSIIGAIILGLCTLRSGSLARKKSQGERSDPLQTNETSKSRNLGRALFRGLFAAFFLVFLLFVGLTFLALDKQKRAVAAKASAQAAQSEQMSRIRAQVMQPHSSDQVPAVTVIVPNDRLASEEASATSKVQSDVSTTILGGIVTVVVFGLGVIIVIGAFRREKGRPLTNPFGRSLTEQLREIEQLGKEGIIPQDQMLSLRAAILERLRKQHGIPAATPPKASPKSL